MPQACQVGDPVFAISLIEKNLKIVTSENCFFFQAEDGIRDRSPSRGLGDVYKRQSQDTFKKAEASLAAQQLFPTPKGPWTLNC